MPPLIPHFAEIASDYDVLLCDIWGVVHNGLEAFPAACDALMRARARGAAVVSLCLGRPAETRQKPRPGRAWLAGSSAAASALRAHVRRFAPVVSANSSTVGWAQA